MSTRTFKGFLLMQQSKWEAEPQIIFREYEAKTDEYTTYATVRSHSFEADIPDDFDPTAQVIQQLEVQKTALRLKLAEELAKLDERISNLSCLTNEAA